MSCSSTYARGSGEGLTGPLLIVEEVEADVIDTATITSSTGTVNFANVHVTGLPSQGIDSVGLNVLPDKAQLVFGTSPYPPAISLEFPRLIVTADYSDLKGVISTDLGHIDTLSSSTISAGNISGQIANIATVNTSILSGSTANIATVNSSYLNADRADIPLLLNQSLETESVTTGGVELYVDWNATATQLPALALLNNPLYGYNSAGKKDGFKLGNLLIDLGEGAAGEALMYLAKQGGGWLLSAAGDALSLMSGYASLSEAGLSIGASAAGTGAALGGDLAAFEAGSEGLVLASTASEAATMFSSAGVLSAEGLGFATEFAEAGESLLAGIESSTAEFSEVLQTPSLFQTITGANRWLAL